LRLRVRPEQERLVASNAVSIAEAYFHQEAWFRAIYADETPVGFLMLHDENLRDHPEKRDFYSLWRFMVDAEHQGKGYGIRATRLLIEHVKSNPNARELLVSYVPGEGSPEGFYRKIGFEHTGNTTHGELEMRLLLSR
jgi:diamine N-acetyltransferase